jgi:phosphoribosyl-AMP cyclohydrolase
VQLEHGEKEKGSVMAQFDVTTLKYDANGLIPAIAQDATTGEVLMMAWMNSDAVRKTMETGKVTYWSRSRQEFWVKGLTSGHTQELKSFYFDCDRDCLLVKVHQIGAACHTNRRHCFYTEVKDGEEIEILKPMP